MLIWYVRWLDIEIRYINIECFVKAKHSLMLTFNVDWFQAFSIGWINSGGARYFIVNSLPLDQRYKSGKVVLAASCKETKKLSKHQINHYMEPLVDELVKLYIGVPASLSMPEVELKKEMRMLVSLASVFHFAPNMRRRRKATQRKHQRPYAYHCLWSAVRDRSALLMVACDIPAASKVSGAQVSAPIGIATSAKSSFPAHQSHPLKPDFSGSTEQEPSTSRPHTRKRITHWMPTYGKMPAPLPHISHCICACISNKRRSGPPAVQWLCLANFLHCLFLELYPSRPHTSWYQAHAITAGLIRDMLWTLLQVMEQHNPCTRHYQSAGQYLQNIQLTNSRLSYMREFPPSRHHRRKWC